MSNNLIKYTNKIALIGLVIISIIFMTFLIYKYVIPYIGDCLLAISLGLFVFAWFTYFILNYKAQTKTKIEKNEEVSLLSDNPIMLDNTFVKPIQNIMDAHIFTSSFSMALIGKWGSGKSSYLQTLEDKLKNDKRYEVISINVWQLENSENITHELKKELDNIIFKYDKVVWLTQVIKRIFIQDYFAIISKYLTKSPMKVSFAFEPTLKDSKRNLKNILNDVLNGRKIILLIDELDRIDSEADILNIFKVIHYVDDFEDIFTITAMDIEQIEKKIGDINYIHKIFNLKYTLPTVDKDKIIKFYKDKVFKQLVPSYIGEEEFKNISVIAIISNYRIIKNSFNDTIIFISALKEKHPNDWDSYISFEFVFLLNLIKAVDFEFYSYIINASNMHTILNFIKIKDEAKKKEYLEDKILLTELSSTSQFKNLCSVIKYATLSNNQYLDIYLAYNIYNYHVTEQQYSDFEQNISSIKKYYEEALEIPDHKGKFINILLDKSISSDTPNTKIVSIIIEIFLENDSELFGYDYSKYGLLNDLTNPILINNITDSIFINLLKNEKVGYELIKKILDRFLNNSERLKYTEENVLKFIKIYLTPLNNQNLNDKLAYFYQILNPINNNVNSLEIYKILYSFSKNLPEPSNHLTQLFDLHNLQSIKQLIDYLQINDIEIKNKDNYRIFINDSSEYLSGEKLKEQLKE